jgi:hypothetical protein
MSPWRVGGVSAAALMALVQVMTGAAGSLDSEPSMDAALAELERARSLDGHRERWLARLAAADRLEAAAWSDEAEQMQALECVEVAADELVALGILDEAAQLWGRVVERTLDGPARARACLRWAQILRRGGESRAAAAAYERAAEDPQAAAEVREEARLWAARMAIEDGDRAAGLRGLERLANSAEDPAFSIRAFDLLARAAIERGDLEGAAGWLETARERWSEECRAVTPRGERVRRGLIGMGSVIELRLAIFDRGW